MFIRCLDTAITLSIEDIDIINRFLNRILRLIMDENTRKIKSSITNDTPDDKQLKLLHKTIKKVTMDIEDGDMKFNTSIAQMMIFINELYKLESISKEVIEKFVLILAPFAPHLSEELWERFGNRGSVSTVPWPEYDETLAKSDSVVIAFSVNGKMRDKMEMDSDTDEKILEQAALENEKVLKHIFGKNIIKIITVKNRMVNIVVK